MSKFNRITKFVVMIVMLGACCATNSFAQRSKGRRPAVRTVSMKTTLEPPRTYGGRLMGNKIELRRIDDKVRLDYIVTGARIADGRLQLEGTLNGDGGAESHPTMATVIGSMARARQVWNWNNDSKPGRLKNRATAATPPQGGVAQGTVTEGGVTRNPERAGNVGQLSQATQSTSRSTPTPTSPEGRASTTNGALTEQTQSLYTPSDAGSGCDIVYLKMEIASGASAVSNKTAPPVQVGVVLASRDNVAGEQINKALCRVVRAIKGGEATEAPLSDLNKLLATK